MSLKKMAYAYTVDITIFSIDGKFRQILQSYMLLLNPAVFMHFWPCS